MTDFIDSLNRLVHIEKEPLRIISLVPSITELLFDLGLENRIAGITRFCIHPEKKTQNVPKVGGTENIDFAKIKELRPDLILCSKEENKEKEIYQLMENYPVFVSDVRSFNDAINLIYETGLITGKEIEAQKIIAKINEGFQSVNMNKKKISAVYLIWKNPYMTINGDTFISDMLKTAGFDNVFKNKAERYPVVTIEDIAKSNPQVVLLSSEPYSFKEKDKMELMMSLQYSEIMHIDGEMFSWYGSRMIRAADYFKKLNF
jgi:ABC-type Fe3+-hydroxamate transport system substrate-binding protein